MPKPATNPLIESPQRIEPTRIESLPEEVVDLVAELTAASAKLGQALHPRTAASLAGQVRIMNTYYSNLIEGHRTRPGDIARALAGQFDQDNEKRDLQLEAAAHVRVQEHIDRMAAEDRLPEPASTTFIRWLHEEFYRDAPEAMLRVADRNRAFLMVPGEWRRRPEEDVVVGRHQPPSSERVADFMAYFANQYRFAPLGKSARIIAMAAAHHRFNYIHPFPDGNGRVSRLMSHAMAHEVGIGAHGLWSISRGLARGLKSRGEYMRQMDLADTPRRGDLDGRGNLSEQALIRFINWFLSVCLDQVRFMSGMLALEGLIDRVRRFVQQHGHVLRPEAARLLEEALIRGEFQRGEAARITGLPERTARRILNDVTAIGLLASDTPKGAVSLRFPAEAQDILFPRLFLES